MSLNEYDQDYDEQDVSVPNTMPDGRYTLEITGVDHKTDKEGHDVLLVFMSVREPSKFAGEVGCHRFSFAGPHPEYTARALKQFNQAMKLDSLRPSSFEMEAVRAMFKGFIIEATKETKIQGTNRYASWKYFLLISKPAGLDNDGSDLDAPPSGKSPDLDEEIDISETPFE